MVLHIVRSMENVLYILTFICNMLVRIMPRLLVYTYAHVYNPFSCVWSIFLQTLGVSWCSFWLLQIDLELEQSSGGTRRHASASVSRTSFSANTPASQKRAIQQLRQSLTFSDHSVSGIMSHVEGLYMYNAKAIVILYT